MVLVWEWKFIFAVSQTWTVNLSLHVKANIVPSLKDPSGLVGWCLSKAKGSTQFLNS